MLAKLGMAVAPADAVDLLVECHGRIRSFLAMARRIADAPEAEAVDVADAAYRVHRYFSVALPLHARDEEESVLPRLLGRDPAVDRELEAMVRQHAEHQAPLDALVGACAKLARDPGLRAELAPVVGRAAAELERHFADHLAREEGVVFPALRRFLEQAADSAIAREIRLRRRESQAGAERR